MLRTSAALGLLFGWTYTFAAAAAPPAVPREQPALHALADAPSEAQLRATVEAAFAAGGMSAGLPESECRATIRSALDWSIRTARARPAA